MANKSKKEVSRKKNSKQKAKVIEDEEEKLCTGEECLAKEQGILPEETPEEKELDMDLGEEDEDIYEPEGREKLVEDEELDPSEEGFMEGASELGQLGKDALTGKPLMDADEIIEMELEGKLYRFVSRENAEKFREKRLKDKKKGKK